MVVSGCDGRLWLRGAALALSQGMNTITLPRPSLWLTRFVIGMEEQDCRDYAAFIYSTPDHSRAQQRSESGHAQ